MELLYLFNNPWLPHDKFFSKTSIGKVVLAFIINCFLQSTVQAQTKHPSRQLLRRNLSAQSPEPPNPYADIDKKALLIPDSLTKSTKAIAAYINANFRSNEDKVRATFIWVAANIRYDVPNMYAINYYEKRKTK